jgi:hypothetical protein
MHARERLQLAPTCRAVRPPACPLSGVDLTRSRRRGGGTVLDPLRIRNARYELSESGPKAIICESVWLEQADTPLAADSALN